MNPLLGTQQPSEPARFGHHLLHGHPGQAGQSLRQRWPRAEAADGAVLVLNKSRELPGANTQGKQVSLIPSESVSYLCPC